MRFDGGPAMVELQKLEIATGLSIVYTTVVPGRFDRFAARVLGPDAGTEERDKLKKGLTEVRDFLLDQIKVYEKTIGLKTYDGKGRRRIPRKGTGGSTR